MSHFILSEKSISKKKKKVDLSKKFILGIEFGFGFLNLKANRTLIYSLTCSVSNDYQNFFLFHFFFV